MESKTIFTVTGIAVLCILAYVLISSETSEQPPAETTTLPAGTPAEALSDIQVDACNAADEAGTCYTKLRELNMVTPQECCKHLKKCCLTVS